MAGSAWRLSAVTNSVQRFDVNGDGHIDSSSTTQDTYVDLYDFARLVQADFSDTTIQTDAQAVMNAVAAYVITEHYGSTAAMNLNHGHGVSIFYPATASSFYNVNNYAFAVGATWPLRSTFRPRTTQDTISWGPMLVSYFQATQPGGSDNPTPPPPLPMLGISKNIYLPFIAR